MVEYHQNQLDQTFAALADPTRRAILARLVAGDAGVGEIARPFDISLNAVSKHLKVLEHAGLVRREVRGREHRIALESAPLAEADAWITTQRAFWERQVDALARFLDAQGQETPAEELP